MNRFRYEPLTRWLGSTNKVAFAVFAASAAFLLYTCIYAFRKAFSAATFDELVYAGISYKVWLVIFQVAGYALSKFAGITLMAELKAGNRVYGILLLTAVAGISWLLFAICPAPYNIVFLFTNGLPLGLAWGLIFSYLEGRTTSEALGAGLSVSFIFSSGFARTAGAWTMNTWNVTETWMPFVVSCLFLLPLLLFLWLLDHLPPPNNEDLSQRTQRVPMNASARKKFLDEFGPGILLLILAYIWLTTLRDFRDNFSAELWRSLGFGDSPEIFTQTEIPIALVVLIAIGCMVFIHDNRKALMINHVMVLGGFVIIGLAALLFQINWIGPVPLMILAGLGLYLSYVPFNCIFFERLIAASKLPGTVGFVMYLADAFGYLGSVGILLFKEIWTTHLSWLAFYLHSSYVVCVAGILCMSASMIYFRKKFYSRDQTKKVFPELSLKP